ncbi:MAG: FprA family A-type flavoprotein [Candidatus Acetothermia bacterium]|jgi:flavorubredoxin|nr:FprA family A-type flavoprotein [Candidatus Acetothermia bacterium]MDH7505256.1 FprA family A-type flavoprotein [Candidatus Acetothermia bacterium]
MRPREIQDGVYWLGAIDWDRRLFDSLIPLPDGTSYNAYLIRGREKAALLDSVDPRMSEHLLAQLEDVEALDYVVSHHAEPDHSGAIPKVIERYPKAKVLTTPKGKGLLIDLFAIPEERIEPVEDGQILSLGDKTLRFIHLPWVHWPETMVSYLEEARVLFTCDLFGSHLATTDLYADEGRVYEPAKRYYAEIMMPFRGVIAKHLEKLKDYRIELIAPSHGPIYRRPEFILEAYRDWVAGLPKNLAVIAYVSMWGSTKRMVERLVGALAERGVKVKRFDLAETDVGKLAMALVDAATVVIGTPTVLGGPHPLAAYAAYLANALRPKLRFVSVIGSYGWGGKAVEQLAGLLSNLKVELLEPVICKGAPRKADLQALDKLAETIAERHRSLGLG